MLVSTNQGDNVMFGFELITRRAHEWNNERRQRALRSKISQLPIHVQKDIGWQAIDTRQTAAGAAAETRARPIL
jgi:hypothetical protein